MGGVGLITENTLSLAEVRRRFVQGWLALALRGGFGKLVSLGSLVLLSRQLTPAAFGAFAILQFPLGLLSLVTDAGLHAALVQRATLTPADERAGFTLRLALALGLGLLLAAAAGLLGQLYALDTAARWALRALALAPLIDAFGAVPGMRLTRSLRFDRLAWAEMGSLLAGQGTAVLLALNGAGLWSLVGGSLATTVAGALLVNIFAPWRPRLGLDREVAQRLLRFGLPYQTQGLLHLFKDRVIPALGGLFLGAGTVGALAWAQDLARWPRLPADYAARVGFPALARLQHDPAALTRALREALAWVLTLTAATTGAALALAPALVGPIFGAQWAPAVGSLLIFLAQTPLDALAALLLPVIYAGGQAGRGLWLSTLWVALTWLLCGAALALWPDLRAIPLASPWPPCAPCSSSPAACRRMCP